MSRRSSLDTSRQLRELIHSTLARSPHLAGKQLRIEMSEQGIVLKGVVRSYYQKQLAQETVRSIDGVERVQNELEVAWSR